MIRIGAIEVHCHRARALEGPRDFVNRFEVREKFHVLEGRVIRAIEALPDQGRLDRFLWRFVAHVSFWPRFTSSAFQSF